MRLGMFAGTLAASVGFLATTAGDSRACGGCFHPPSQNATVVTDHRMVFAVSPTQTTLYDQIEYSGSPSDFGWVLPIHGKVTLGVSSDLLFSTLNQVTQTTILAPPYPCQPCNCARNGPTAAGFAAADGSVASDSGGVTVYAQQVVGPYATVQLHPNSTSDTAALTAWLQANSYSIPATVDPIIAAYVSEGFDFLAVKLVPGQGVQAMRPISVTTPGASVALPLRMVAAGTGSRVGITLWVVASGRYEPKNFGWFTISPSSLVWDWSTNSSNYTTLRAQKEQQLANAAWQIESSLDLSPYGIESTVLRDPTASDYSPIPQSDGGAGQTAQEVRAQDLNTLFPTGGTSVRITRMRADLSQSALATDLILQASADQSSISNTYQANLSINVSCPVCSCGSGSGSGGSGAGSGFGFGGSGNGLGSSGNGFGSSGGGTSNGGMAVGAMGDGGTAAAPGQESFGCATSSAEPPGAGLFATLAGLVGVALFRARARRKR
jgi:MYXO-CTERM domain-containing protein